MTQVLALLLATSVWLHSHQSDTAVPREVFMVVWRRDYDFPEEENWNEIRSVHLDLQQANGMALGVFQEAWSKFDHEEEILDLGKEDFDQWTIPGTSGLDSCERGVYWSSTGEVRYAEKNDEWMFWVVVIRKEISS